MTNNNNKTWKLDNIEKKDIVNLNNVMENDADTEETKEYTDKVEAERSSFKIDDHKSYDASDSDKKSQMEFRLTDLKHNDGLKLSSNASLEDRLKLLNRVGKPKWQIVAEYDVVVTDKDTFFIGTNTIVKTELVISLLFNRLLGGVKQKVGIIDNLPFNSEGLFFDFIKSSLDNNSHLKFVSEQLTEALRSIITKIDIIPLLIYEEFKINAGKKAYPMSDGVYLFNDDTDKLNEDDLKLYDSLKQTFIPLGGGEDETKTQDGMNNDDETAKSDGYDTNKLNSTEDSIDEDDKKVETFREV